MKILVFLAIALVIPLYAQHLIDIEHAVTTSDPQILHTLLHKHSLIDEQKKEYQARAYALLQTQEETFKKKIEKYNAFETTSSGILFCANAVFGAYILKTLYERKFSKAIIQSTYLSISTWLMYILRKRGIQKEHIYRQELCTEYNSLVTKALEVYLLLHGWYYTENNIMTGPLLPLPVLLRYYEYNVLPHGYNLQKVDYHIQSLASNHAHP